MNNEMNSDRWKRIEQLCFEAESMEQPGRDTFLENACGRDDALLAEIKSLLDQSDSQRLQQPLVQVQSSFVFSEEESADKMMGPYRLIRTLASGGMGRVYLAVRDDDQFERFVALKVIRRGLVSDEVLSRFYEERQILASLNHPNIARLFDGGTTDDGIPWFAMEYIEGKSITEYCKLHDLNLDDKINLFMTVCSAVQYAHQNLVIHHDLKPANILITPEGTPKLLDFGIAKLTTLEQQTGKIQNQNRMMTPDYASPEQVRNESVSTVSDVYALGVLLYELLGGALPYQFNKRTPAAIERTICNSIPKQPSAISGAKGLKGDLDSIIMKALRKEPGERYSSVEQLAHDLDRYQQTLPVLARNDSFIYHAKKFANRNKWSVVGSVAVAILVIAFSTVTYMQSQAIKDRAVEAEQQRDRAEEVSNFLTGLFETVDPSEAENKSLTAIELLQRGADRVENELTDQPRLQSNLYLVISDVYESLGLYDEGLDLAQKAYALLRSTHKGDHGEIARSLNAMGWFYRQKGNYEKADSLLTAGLKMRRNLFGDEHLDVARSLNDLAVLKQSRGDYTATDTLLRKAIEIRKSVAGEQDESVGVVLSNYAALKYRLGDVLAAEEKMREALHIFQADVGNNDMRTANVMNNLAAILLSQGELDEAEPLYRKTLKVRLQLLGEEHPDVASSYAHLGSLLANMGQIEEAETQLLKALELREKLLGENHVLVGVSKKVLGDLYKGMEDYPKSEKYLDGAVKTFRNKYPDGHARTAEALDLLGEVYMGMNDSVHAEPQFREAMNLRVRFYGNEDTRTAASMIKLGVCLVKNGEISESKELLESGLEVLNESDQSSQELKNLAANTLAQL